MATNGTNAANDTTKKNVTEKDSKAVDVKVVAEKKEVVEEPKAKVEKTATRTRKAADEKKPAAKTRKPRTPKAVAKTTATPKAARTTKKGIKTELFLEYGDVQISQEEILKKVKQSYKEQGKKIGEIKSVNIYLKPEERKIYYVVNGNQTSSTDL